VGSPKLVNPKPGDFGRFQGAAGAVEFVLGQIGEICGLNLVGIAVQMKSRNALPLNLDLDYCH